jgi:hypothetical protein
MMLCRKQVLPLALLAVLALTAPGCLRYRTYRVDTGGSELVLRRVDGEQLEAGGGELALQPVDRSLQRSVESLRGKRIRVPAPDQGTIDGDVVDVTAATLQVRGQLAGSPIDNAQTSIYDIDLARVASIDVADSRGEAALIAAVAVGTLAALLAMVVQGLGSAEWN